jgi:choline dehydrogenase-like flavoprotein
MKRTKQIMRRAGFPVVLMRIFGNKTMSHQCGKARLGADPHKPVVDLNCRSHDVPNL